MTDNLQINVLGGGQRSLDIRVHTQQPYGDAATQTGLPEGRAVKWGKPDEGHVRVYLGRDAYSQMMAHARSGVRGGERVEVGGILLGRPYQDSRGDITHVVIDQALPDEHGISRSSTFNFTHESWAALVKEAETGFPHLRIVGWYHSHPNFGIFYSGTDMTSQKTYFGTPWRVGVVVDPVREEGGFFAVSPLTGEVVELPGFYEPVGQNGHNWVIWRNWERAAALVRNPTPAPIRVQPGQSPPVPGPTESPETGWLQKNRLVAAILIGLSLSVLFSLIFLNQIQVEVQELRATVEVLSGQEVDKTTPSETPPASPYPHKTPLQPGLGPGKSEKSATPTPKPPTATATTPATATEAPPTPSP